MLFTPTGRDQDLIGRLLDRRGLATVRCRSSADFLDAVQAGRGPLIVADEGLSEAELEQIPRLLDKQPPWSDLPMILSISVDGS